MLGENISYFYDINKKGEPSFYFSYFNDIGSRSATNQVLAATLGVFTFCSMLENCFLLALILFHKSLYTVTNMLILNTSVVSVLLLMPSAVACYTMTQRQWTMGTTFCKISAAVMLVSAFVLIWTMAVIAYDRYRHICHASKNQITLKMCMIVNCVMWLCGCLMTVSSIATIHTKPVTLGDEVYTICTKETSTTSKLLILVALLLGFLAPLTIIMVCYRKVLKKIAHSHARVSKLKSALTNSGIQSISATMAEDMSFQKNKVNPEEQSAAVQKRVYRYRLVTKKLIALVGIFITMWLPGVLFMGWLQVDTMVGTFILRAWMMHLVMLLLNVNACITPMFYVVADREMKQILRRKMRCQSESF